MNLGDTLRDTVTGLTGIAVSKHEYLNGCVRFALQPKEIKDGKPVDVTVVDVEQLEMVTVAKSREVRPSGGPRDEPSRPSIPSR